MNTAQVPCHTEEVADSETLSVIPPDQVHTLQMMAKLTCPLKESEEANSESTEKMGMD
jgi:hypothetical protein